MNQNKSFTLVLLLLVICIAVIVRQSMRVQNLKGDLEIRNIDFKKKNKQLELTKDSLRVLKKESIERDSLWSGIVKDQLNALVQERKKVSYITKRYEIIKNSPPPAWDNKQLDSLLFAIIGH